ncbi:MAG: 2-dehydropantoate 2-reductase [Pseudomonadota bacterium]
MKFATVATGGVNGWLAWKLARGGAEVACLARGAHLAAIRERGITVRQGGAEATARPAAASDDPAEIGVVDAVFVAVKAQDLDAIAPRIRPMVGEGTVAIPFLNGVEASSRLAAVLGEAPVLEGTCGISVFLAEPDVIEKVGDFNWFRFGERDGARSARAEAVAEAMRAAGVDAAVPEDIRAALWRKFMTLSTMSGITAAGRCTSGDVRGAEPLAALARAAIAETAALARAEGVAVTAQDEAAVWEGIKAMPAEMRASQANDLAAGKPLEVDWLSGAVARMSAARGLDALVHRTLHALLTPFRDGGR